MPPPTMTYEQCSTIFHPWCSRYALYLAVLLYFSLLYKLLKQHKNGEKGYGLPISNLGRTAESVQTRYFVERARFFISSKMAGRNCWPAAPMAYENFIRVGLGGDTHQFQEGMSIMLDELLRRRG